MGPVRASPRISVNPFVEYLSRASPARRRTIIRQQKHPADFMVAYYEDAMKAIVRRLSKAIEEADLDKEIDRLNKTKPRNDYEIGRFRTNALALTHFKGLYGQITAKLGALSDLTMDPVPPMPMFVTIHDVEISVRPELILQAKSGKGTPIVGALKFYCRADEDHGLTKNGADYLGVLVRECLAQSFPTQRILPSACLVVDLFGDKIHSAPTTHLQKMKDIEAACDEIAAAWPLV
jgi:hypothetical protein